VSEREVQARLLEVRGRLASWYGLAADEARLLVLAREAADRGNVARPMPPTLHGLRGGRLCPGC
jgi:hypothetical protein